MRRFAFALAACVMSIPALAQTPGPAPSAPAAPPVGAQPSDRPQVSPEQRARFRAAREACAAELKPRDLPRGERRIAMRSCMQAKVPDLPQRFGRTGSRRAEMRQVRDACRAELQGKRLPRDERRQAMQTCMVAKKPELAKVFSCRDEAVKKNLSPGPERREFMRSCIRA
jgi:hypothetical protein